MTDTSEPNEPTHRLSCHCGAVRIDLVLPEGIRDPRRCDCSYCRRRQAMVASIAPSQMTIVAGAENLTRYQFNTGTAEHYFCKTCGIYTHHRRRSNPNEFAFNIACVEGVNPFDYGDVPVFDGVNHPADR
jgi:hypothetical protein